jgi:hypothetical protein
VAVVLPRSAMALKVLDNLTIDWWQALGIKVFGIPRVGEIERDPMRTGNIVFIKVNC